MKKQLIALVLIGVLVFGFAGIPEAKADVLTGILNQVSLIAQELSAIRNHLSGLALGGAMNETQTNDVQQALNELPTMASSLTVSHETSAPQTAALYSATAITSQNSPLSFTGSLTYGQTSNQVKELQNWLIENNFLTPGDNSGYYSNATVAAVLAFQKAKGINGDGTVVGPQTEAAIITTGNPAPQEGWPVIPQPPVVGGTLSVNPNLSLSGNQQPVTCTYTTTALATPASQIISVGTTSFTFANIKFTAPSNCNINLDQLEVIATSPVSGVLANLQVYNGTAQIGQTVASPTTGNYFGSNGVPLNIQIPAGTSVTLALKADVIGIGSGAKVLGISSSTGTGVPVGTTTQIGFSDENKYWGQGMKITAGICVPTFNYITQWGTAGTGPGQFSYMYGATINPTGNILYESDYTNNRIQEFTLNGQYITQWGTGGSGNGQFNWPEGIAFGPNGNLYVVDQYNFRVQEFTPSGQYITQWGSHGNGNGQFEEPFGLAIDSSGNVYVTDSFDDNVQKFTANGQYITQWGTTGSGDGQLYGPVGIVVDQNNDVYVVDTINYRVEKFTSSGQYLSQFGSYGTGGGQFIINQGIDVTPNAIYVTDRWGPPYDRIEEFTLGGQFVAQFGTYGTGDGQFNWPANVITDSSGDLYVMDAYNNRIQKFKPTGC